MLNLVLAILVRLLPKCEDSLELTHEQQNNVGRIEKFLWAAERHNIMCFLFNGNKTNFNQEATFRDINRYFCTGNSSVMDITLTELLLEKRVSHFHWDLVLRNIELGNYFHSWDGIFFILREYEEHISGKIVEREIAVNRIYPDDEVSVRILYQDINRYGVAKKRKYSYALGNLFMSNNQHAARDFDAHKTRISNAIARENIIYESERQFLNYNKWTALEIEQRSQEILDFVIEKWQLPPLPANFWKDYFN